MEKSRPGTQPPELTREDLKKIQKSMRKPEFMGLLNEYMVEISDPKNKQQYDDYLKQMEKQKQLPKHMKLVKPNAEFCIKTTLTSQKNKTQQMKFFINFCSAEQMQKPSFQPYTNQKGQTGQSWKIPNSMGKIRYDQDKKGNVCNTVDSVMNPYTFVLARNPAFQAMIINIALQSAQKQLGQRKQILSKDYVKLQNLKCKGGQPALLPLRIIEGKIYNKGEGQQQRDQKGKETRLEKQLNQKKQQHQKQKQLEKKRLQQQKQKEIEELENEVRQNKIQQIQDGKGPQRPKFHTIYTYPIDYADYLETKIQSHKKKPTAFNIQFKIPKVDAFSEITSLDISENKLLLDIGQKYFIDLQFSELKIKFKLLTNQSKAKFDKKKKTLRITIPIDKSSIIDKQFPKPQNDLQSLDQTPINNQVTNIQKTSNQQAQVVQNPTWQNKNKILEITQNNVSLQFIKKQQMEVKKQQKKMIQQIDEDDDAIKQLGVVKYQAKIQKKQLPRAIQKPLTYKFQEVKQKVFLIINAPNYTKNDIEIIKYKNEILIKWKKGDNIEFINLQIQRQDYNPMKCVDKFVNNFIVINIDKSKAEFWQSKSIESHEISLQQFDKKFNTYKEQLRLITEIQLKKQQQLRKQQDKKNQNTVQKIIPNKVEEQQQIKQKTLDNNKILQPKENEVKNQQIIEDLKINKIKNIQFLPFRIRLAETLD